MRDWVTLVHGPMKLYRFPDNLVALCTHGPHGLHGPRPSVEVGQLGWSGVSTGAVTPRVEAELQWQLDGPRKEGREGNFETAA